MANDDDDASMRSKIGKKKHYPFGTPSHTSHPFSAFAHIQGKDNNAFAKSLAMATGIHAEIVEETPTRFQKPKKDTISKSTRRRVSSADDGEEEEESPLDDIPDLEGMEPCKQAPCQAVLKALLDVQLKNKLERIEIEDEHDRLTEDLETLQEEVATAEANVDKKMEMANQLETTLNKLLEKVEKLEQNKEFLTKERNDINNKLMLLETEKQKSNRKLELAQKALNDARWRKKKEAIAQNVEDGLTLPPSTISEQIIVQATTVKASEGVSLSNTSYAVLARRGVTDYSERSMGVLSVPAFVGEHRNHDKKAFDKYMDRHYEKLRSSSSASRMLQAQLGTLSFASVDYSHAAAKGEDGDWPQRRRGQFGVGAEGKGRDSVSYGGSSHGGQLNSSASLSDSTLKSAHYSSGSTRRTGSTARSSTSSLGGSKKQIRLQPLSSNNSRNHNGGSIAETTRASSAGMSTWDSSTVDDNSTYSDLPSLDATFITNRARAAYGRSHTVGKLRKLKRDGNDTDEEKTEEEKQAKEQADKEIAAKLRAAAKKGGNITLTMERMKPSVLTIRHPGMDIFGDSMTLKSID